MQRCNPQYVRISLLVLLGGSLAVIAVLQRSVGVDDLLAAQKGANVKVRVYEEGHVPVTTVHLTSDDPLCATLKQILQDGKPQWKWFGYRPDLSTQSFRIELETPTHLTRLDSGGAMRIIYSNGRERNAHMPRSKRVYDRIVEVLRASDATSEATRQGDDRKPP